MTATASLSLLYARFDKSKSYSVVEQLHLHKIRPILLLPTNSKGKDIYHEHINNFTRLVFCVELQQN